ncbi:hypothetical protein DFH28DRAFT_910456, partial [Melampsora americana]
MKLTTSMQEAFSEQGKKIRISKIRPKPWWDKEVLNPLIKNRNIARKWMLYNRSENAEKSYWYWQSKFREKVEELKRNHWRNFLGKCTNTQTFTAYNYTKARSSNRVEPLKTEEGKTTSQKKEQAEILLKTMEVNKLEWENSDIHPIDSMQEDFEPISTHEIKSIIKHLPNGKAVG